jgi:hypothetical protein
VKTVNRMIEFSPCEQGWRRCNTCGIEGVQLVNVIFYLDVARIRQSVTTLCRSCCNDLHQGAATAMKTVFVAQQEEVSRGWAYPLKRAKNTKLHYFVSGQSLCRRYTEKVLALMSEPQHPYECCTQCLVRAKKHGLQD